MRRTEGKTRSVLRERLEARRAEIEEATLARVYAIADPGEAPDPEYLEGLRGSVSIALDYALEILESSADNPPPVPVALLAQARLAARNGVTLDAVLRRYFAGYSLLGYFLIEEAAKDGLLSGEDLQRLVGTQAGLFDRFLKAIGEEHSREWEPQEASLEERHAARIERLLAGEPIDTSDLPYDFEGWHLGVVASGPEAKQAVRSLAEPRDCRLLCIPREGEVLWAWLGTRRSPDSLELDQLASSPLPEGTCLAFGEPGHGVGGWRLTHRQAAAAFPMTQRSPDSPTRYADVAVVASILQDDLLVASLGHLYLDPLTRERDEGKTLKATLRAYFSSEQNISSAAAMLGVSRRTIANRLRKIERRWKRPLRTVLVEVDAILRIDDLDTPSQPGKNNSAQLL